MSGGADEKTKEKEDNERSRTMRYYMRLYTVYVTIYNNNNNNMINCTYTVFLICIVVNCHFK